MENLNMNPSNLKMWAGVAIAVFAAIILVGWMWWAKPAAAPSSETGLTTTDTTSQIDKELQATDIANPADELKTTDADVNSL